jgi:uncharacterized protein YcfJ
MDSRRMVSWMAVGVVAAAPAFASHGDDRDFENSSNSEYDFAQVISVDPLVREVHVSVPRRECYDETRYVPVDADYERGHGHEQNAAGGMILGGLLGAVIGHQIDGRHSRGTAAIAGAVIGSAIGHEVAEQGRGGERDYRRDELRAVAAEHCEIRNEEHVEQRIDGYRVTYSYNGRSYITQMPSDPGRRIRVRVSIDPVG